MSSLWDCAARPETSNLPLFLFGEAMGGAVAIKASWKRATAYRGMILVAPLVKVRFAFTHSCLVCTHSGQLRVQWTAGSTVHAQCTDSSWGCMNAKMAVPERRGGRATPQDPWGMSLYASRVIA